jgi:Ca2+-binding RTX toxin-like protein
MGMRRLVLLLSSMLLVTLLASGIAWASIDCKAKTTCKGNDKPNVMFGSGGADIMRGFGGADSMDGDLGNDRMYGGDGADGGWD